MRLPQPSFYALFALTGVTISSVLIVYTYSSVASTFFICAAMFGALSVYGYTTKRSLTGMGSFLFYGAYRYYHCFYC